MLEQDAATMEARGMARATERAWFRVRDILALAQKLSEDPRREERLRTHKCKVCFYQARLAGQAFTSRPCMCCGEPQTYQTTATDVLCLECATAHHLCKGCGGDIEMDTKRRDWPILNPKK